MKYIVITLLLGIAFLCYGFYKIIKCIEDEEDLLWINDDEID